MISDVLSEAVAEIDRYMTEPAFARAYPYRGADGKLTVMACELNSLRDHMDTVRERLDCQAAGGEF